jgi:predicted acyl esterase
VFGDSQGQLAAKLCDVFPDGQARLVSVGVINLNHFKSSQQPEELEPGARCRSYDRYI